MKTFEVLGFHPSLAQGILLKPWVSTGWWSNLLFSCIYNETSWKPEPFSTRRSKHLPDVLPLPAPGLGPCVSFPCLWQHSSRCGRLPADGESLNGGKGSPTWLPPREQWHCCCERGREGGACLRGEAGCESWGAEVQVLLRCGDPINNPFSPRWVLISSREDFLQHYYFLCISVYTASVQFRSLAYDLENCK